MFVPQIALHRDGPPWPSFPIIDKLAVTGGRQLVYNNRAVNGFSSKNHPLYIALTDGKNNKKTQQTPPPPPKKKKKKKKNPTQKPKK